MTFYDTYKYVRLTGKSDKMHNNTNNTGRGNENLNNFVIIMNYVVYVLIQYVP